MDNNEILDASSIDLMDDSIIDDTSSGGSNGSSSVN